MEHGAYTVHIDDFDTYSIMFKMMSVLLHLFRSGAEYCNLWRSRHSNAMLSRPELVHSQGPHRTVHCPLPMGRLTDRLALEYVPQLDIESMIVLDMDSRTGHAGIRVPRPEHLS